MALTSRQTIVLRALRRYWYLLTLHIRELIAREEGRQGWDRDGSITREVMRSLLALGYVRRHEPHPPGDSRTKGPPIYILTQRGSCALARETRDTSDILTVEPTFKDYMSLNHYCRLASTHMKIDAAFAAQSCVKQHALYFEHEIVQPDTSDASKYRLHTSFLDSHVKFCPDSAIEIDLNGYRRALYFEYETGSDGSAQRVANRKHKGAAQHHTTGLFRRHFPQARDMRVIAVCPYQSFLNDMRAAFREKKAEKEKTLSGADLWLFVLDEELNAATFLHSPIFYTVDRGPLPLAPSPAAVSGPVSAGGGGGEGSAGVFCETQDQQ